MQIILSRRGGRRMVLKRVGFRLLGLLKVSCFRQARMEEEANVKETDRFKLILARWTDDSAETSLDCGKRLGSRRCDSGQTSLE